MTFIVATVICLMAFVKNSRELTELTAVILLQTLN